MSSKWCFIDVNKYRDPVHLPNLDNYRNICKDYVDNLILQYQPAGFVIVTPSENDIKTLYGECIDFLKEYCINNNKKIHIFCSCWPASYEKFDYVEFYSFHLYNKTNYLFNCTQFSEGTPDFEKSVSWIGDKSLQLLYTCYNNRPSDYRDHTIDQLSKHNLLNKGIVTYRQMTAQPPANDYWPFKYLKIGTVLEDPREKNFVLNVSKDSSPNLIPPSYHTGLIDIVTESRIGKNEYYLSEKTNKPLLTHKPFLVVSAPGYHKWLKDERGVEPYDEIFDYTFDSIEDDYLRIEGIVDNIKRLSEEYKTPEDLQRLYEIVKEKTMHNFWNYMKTMRKGITEKSFFDFLGINSYQRKYYSYDNIIEKFCNDLTTGELDRVTDWMEYTVIPYIRDYDVGGTRPGHFNHLEADVWPTYQKIFANNPSTLATIKEKYIKHKWLNPIE